jgi:hypothetical protein
MLARSGAISSAKSGIVAPLFEARGLKRFSISAWLLFVIRGILVRPNTATAAGILAPPKLQ